VTNVAVRRPGSSSARPPLWRRLLPSWRQVAFGVVGAIVLVAAFLVIGYLTTTVPDPSGFAVAQSTLVYADDGHTLLGSLGSVNRVDVPLSKVPLAVQHAVLAAEDRHYYSEPGISVTGMLRALYVDLAGGGISQGGSTITQQYTKNAFLTQQRTFSRKIREVFIAVKLDHTQSKARVLDDYLNTIYFGRGAYGIQAASLAYFGVGVSHLDAAQGAVLAGLIDAPSLNDPYVDASAAHARWSYVISGMVKMKWLTPATAAATAYPKVLAPKPPQTLSGPDGFILQEVKLELAAHGFSEAQLTAGGYRVITTINPVAQRAAITAEDQLHAQVPGPVSALVAMVPGSGAVQAWYGGAAYEDPKVPGSFLDLVQAKEQAGSSFKPYTLLTALQQGVTLNTTFDGSSPKVIPGYPVPLQNSANEQCVPCTLSAALYRSINTVFVPLAIQVGPNNVRKTAQAAGVNEPLVGASGNTNAGIGIGIYPVTPLDQATGFATIAAQGIRAEPYLVSKVETPGGSVVYRARPDVRRVFSERITSNATYAMEQVLDNPLGTAYGKALAGGRPAAGKTGTATNPANQNTNDWFVGFTPQLVAAVWLGNLNGGPISGPNGAVFGGGPPAAAWQTFMNLTLANAPIEQFPPPAPINGVSPTAPVAPTFSPPASPAPTFSPSPSTPSPLPSTPSPLPSTPSPKPSLSPPPITPPPTNSPSSSSASPSPSPS
jgi:membrane peptidoglycan carboxypeptidase